MFEGGSRAVWKTQGEEWIENVRVLRRDGKRERPRRMDSNESDEVVGRKTREGRRERGSVTGQME